MAKFLQQCYADFSEFLQPSTPMERNVADAKQCEVAGSETVALGTVALGSDISNRKYPLLLSVEGNIGAGKTTILEQLQSRLANDKTVVFLREPVDIWEGIKDSSGESILAKFYRDPVKYAFPFQIMAYATRVASLRKIICENPDCRMVVCERSLEADRNIFAKMLFDDGLIDEVGYQIYNRFYDTYKQTGDGKVGIVDEFALSGIVYIDADPEVCAERISKRARNGEAGIALDYLKKCKAYHDTWLNNNNSDSISDNSKKILRLHTNQDATYEPGNESDCGNQWINEILNFIRV